MPAPLVRFVLLACVTALLGGCAIVRHPPLTPAELIEDGRVASGVHRRTIDHLVETLARRAARRGDRTLDVLYLSGGGQNGAYGIGFLRGWASRASDPMPVFDLVTGVSTGAIQAPFALVGTAAALDTVAALYENSVMTGAPTFDALFWLRKTGGVLQVDNFRRVIRRVVGPRLAAQMRAGFGEHRQLVIATTDFDLGTGKLWDIGRELEASPAGLDRVRDVIVASSSIPGAFPSTILDRHVHLDGGVISNVVAPLDLEALRTLSQRLRGAGITEPVTVRLWVIMNLWTHAETSVTNPASRGSLSRRMTMLLYNGQQPQILASLETLARSVAADVPGLRLEVRHTAIPADLAEEPAAKALVDPEWMQRLETLGHERARSASPW
ncbi:MAG: patatin-like phospholipase family protein, partial [Candidatus Eisenbacteria bacterium]